MLGIRHSSLARCGKWQRKGYNGQTRESASWMKFWLQWIQWSMLKFRSMLLLNIFMQLWSDLYCWYFFTGVMHGKKASNLEYKISGMMNFHGSVGHNYYPLYVVSLSLHFRLIYLPWLHSLHLWAIFNYHCIVSSVHRREKLTDMVDIGCGIW